MHTDPHHAEYLAAIAGMPDHTLSPVTECRLPSIGDFVSGCSAGKRWSGHVMAVEPGRLAVEVDGAWLVVDPKDITH